MSENTYETVKMTLVDQLKLDPDSIKPDSGISDDLGIDSLDQIRLLMTLEETYQIDLDTVDPESLKTVNDVVALIDGLVV